MNSDIMLLSNKLIYSDRLSCGNQKIANQSLIMPDSLFIQRLHELVPSCGAQCWMKELSLPRQGPSFTVNHLAVLTLSFSRKAVFVDTDLVPATESLVSDLVQNVTEAMLVRQLYRVFASQWHSPGTDCCGYTLPTTN
ncbi:hypothetical protein EDB86DRAFT_754998 [Lactarius hatsudake]|nr:hypothetical protein EDB86DRAFT_754998 [Lactarius hatsudake]